MNNRIQAGVELAEKFGIDTSDRYFVPFDDPNSIGFSIRQAYETEKTKFIPARTKNGQFDHMALIRVAYFDNNPKFTDKNKRPLLFIDISKISNWELKHNFNPQTEHLDEEDAPTPHSLKNSNKSKQPHKLIKTYSFDSDKKCIFEKNTQKKITHNQALEEIFQKHQTHSRLTPHNRFFTPIKWFFTDTTKLIKKNANLLQKHLFLESTQIKWNTTSARPLIKKAKTGETEIFGIKLEVSGDFIALLSVLFVWHFLILQKTLLVSFFTNLSTAKYKSELIIAPLTIASVYLIARGLRWILRKIQIDSYTLLFWQNKAKFWTLALVLFSTMLLLLGIPKLLHKTFLLAIHLNHS